MAELTLNETVIRREGLRHVRETTVTTGVDVVVAPRASGIDVDPRAGAIDVNATARVVDAVTVDRRRNVGGNEASFWNAPLPDDVATIPAETASARAVFAKLPPRAEVLPWTTVPYSLPADYPLTPIQYLGYQGNVANLTDYQRDGIALIAETGFPIPPEHADLVARQIAKGDTDLSFCAVQPDYVTPDGKLRGREFNGWRLRPVDPATHDGFGWTMQEGGRMVGFGAGRFVDRTWGPYFKLDDPGHPDSAYERFGMGSCAAKVSLAASIVTQEDWDRGEIDHAVGIVLPLAYLRKGFRWPANAGDGEATSGALITGQRLRLPLLARMPAGLTRLGQMLWDCARKRGLVVIDRNRGNAWTVRVAPGVPVTSADLLGFPGAELETIAVGNDANPNPLAA